MTELNLVTNKEILEKAVQKAVDGGWKSIITGDVLGINSNKFTGELHLTHNAAWNKGRWALGESVASVIYSQDFAKALWDEAPLNFEHNITVAYEDRIYDEPVWKYHLQEMVIAEDPIAYLGGNI